MANLPSGTTPPYKLPPPESIQWPLVPARELFELKYGKALVESNRRPGQFPVYGSNGKCGSNDEALFQGPGIILGRKGQGPLGVEWSEEDYWVIDTAYSLRPIRKDVDLRYAYFLIKYIGLNHLKDGTSNPTLSRDSFGAQALPLPPLVQQRAIAQMLGALDDKIELNRRMNETLEAMARAIFKSWFVDFEPVHAKAEGHDPGLPKHVADLFSDCFEDSELGEIPVGWEVRPLRDLASYLSRGIGPCYVEAGGISVLNQKCIRDRRVDFSRARRHDPIKKSIEGRTLRLLDILVNSTGVGTLGRIAQLWNLPEKAIIDSHVTVIRAAKDVDPWFLGISLIGREADIEVLAEGSTGQTELSRTRLGELICLVPSLELQASFGNLVEPLFSRLSVNEQASITFAGLRETLLPKLISGELRVKDAARFVEAQR